MSHPDNEEGSSASSVTTNFKQHIATLEDKNQMLQEAVDKRQSYVFYFVIGTLASCLRRYSQDNRQVYHIGSCDQVSSLSC